MPIPDHVLRLRAAVGHELLWLPSVTSVVTDEAGRLLLGLRSDLQVWGLISGILDPGEEPAVGAVREVLEEASVDVEPIAVVALDASDEVHYPNGDVTVYMNTTFWCRHTGGTPAVGDDESLEVGWFEPDQLPEPMMPSSLRRLQSWRQFVANGDDRALFVRS